MLPSPEQQQDLPPATIAELSWALPRRYRDTGRAEAVGRLLLLAGTRMLAP
ncbi:hypothetical protein E2C01_017934 [Portunus trituberculatus]|uniref:Uncharacterized protein n=1 Tax=Portunus trituberculatus TaxID=210409 RepID=A0A5B7DUW0_PORTR|nr:hypothetical protein [Portunus trituberculatus]